MGLVHTGPIVSSELSSTAKIKRAVSRKLDTSTAADKTAILYTSKAITVTAAKGYMVETSTDNAQTIDVGISTSVDGIVAAGAVNNKTADDIVALTIASGAVVADSVITARVKQEHASAGELMVCLEYTEND